MESGNRGILRPQRIEHCTLQCTINLRLSLITGSQFQTFGPATENAWVPKICRELADLTVIGDIRQIADAGDQELRRPAHSSRRGTFELVQWWTVTASLYCTCWGITSQGQVVMHQPRQTTLVFPGPCDQTCCSILIMLQLVRDLLRHGRQNRVAIVDARCDKSEY